MFLTYEMVVKSNYTIRGLEVFSIGITLYIKIKAENNKMHRLEQICGPTFNGWAKWPLLK